MTKPHHSAPGFLHFERQTQTLQKHKRNSTNSINPCELKSESFEDAIMLISSVVALNDEVIEYSIRLEHGGWTVYNIVTLEAAVYRGVRMAHLFAQEAEDLGDMLNAMERAAPGSSIARTDSSR